MKGRENGLRSGPRLRGGFLFAVGIVGRTSPAEILPEMGRFRSFVTCDRIGEIRANDLVCLARGIQQSNLRMGFIGEDWQFDVFINNLTDETAIFTTQDGLFEWGAAQISEGRMHHQTVFTNRPREAGIRYMKRWGG